jgi:hypothetical protein
MRNGEKKPKIKNILWNWVFLCLLLDEKTKDQNDQVIYSSSYLLVVVPKSNPDVF